MNTRLTNDVISRLLGRQESLFQPDLAGNQQQLKERLGGKSMLVIGGAGTIGSWFIKAALQYPLERLFVVDLNENGLAELVRDLRSTPGLRIPPVFITYPLSFGGRVFEKILAGEGPFDIVANFAALKHVRSEKDPYAIEAMFENNFLLANHLLLQLSQYPPERFFCVSTDKAANPVSIMGATKKLMEDVIFSYRDRFRVNTARFANVAFSNGSLLDSFINRFHKNQPLVSPEGIRRFFVSPAESGQLCLLACTLGQSGEVFIPRLSAEKDLKPFTEALDHFLDVLDLEPDYCATEAEAVEKAARIRPGQKTYPVFTFPSDTSGEKPYEEFFTETDQVDWSRFVNLGVVKPAQYMPSEAVSALLEEAAGLFNKPLTKDDIVDFLERHVGGFSYLEKGKTLDQRL